MFEDLIENNEIPEREGILIYNTDTKEHIWVTKEGKVIINDNEIIEDKELHDLFNEAIKELIKIKKEDLEDLLS